MVSINDKNEKQILFIIKYSPPLFIILLTAFVLYAIYSEFQESFISSKNEITSHYINNQKEKIKYDVELVYSMLEKTKNDSEKELKEILKNRVYEAHNLSMGIYNQYKDTHSKSEILEILKKTFKDYRYNKRGYFFFDDINGNKVIYPIDNNIEGKNFINYKDSKGYYFVKNIVKTIKEKTERYDEYYWYKPGDSSGNSYKKISFYKYFEPLNLAIGTGEYINDFREELKQKSLNTLNKLIFNQNNYLYVLDENYNLILHFNKNKIKNNLLQIKDYKNIKKENLKDNSFFYYSEIDNSTISEKNRRKENISRNIEIERKKIGYIKKIKKWNWIVGKSFYIDNINSIIKEKEKILTKKYNNYLFNVFIISLVLITLLMLISFFISKYLESKFKNYRESIKEYLHKNIKQQDILAQQSKYAAMGEMINNIAHQWRQPLSVITTISSGLVLQKEHNILDDKYLIDNLHKITITSNHLSKTIDDFRNFFRPNKDKVKFELNKSIEKVINLVENTTKKYFIDIKIYNSNKDIIMNSYEGELTQALLNIINNANDALKEKKDSNKLIQIFVKQEKFNVVIEIEDNGGGIPDSIKERVYQPYFTTKQKSQGTGIGLYMSKEIIEKHLKGEIKFKSFKGGTKFKIKVPIEL